MKKFLMFMMLFLLFVPLTSCHTVVTGKRCVVQMDSYAENDNYVIFSTAIYNKSTGEFTKTLTEDGKMFSVDSKPSITIQSDSFTVVSSYGNAITHDSFGFDGKMITSETETDENYQENLLEEGFYSSHQRRDWDQEELTRAEQAIWDYSKSKSTKSEFPYWIEGICKETENEILFSVNVYDKVMWSGQSFVNEGVVSSTLNSYHKETKEIVELYSFNQCAIKDFYEDYIYYYKKSDKSLYYENLETETSYLIEKVDDWHFYHTTDKYCLIEDETKNPYEFKLIDITMNHE